MGKTLVAALALVWLLASPASAATYYIDYAGGADTNNGTATGTPWKHAPGMYGCANTCASTTPQVGDSFILKGGVTWPNAALGWHWTWSGNATTASPGCTGPGCIYIGVDQTWYTGGAWARPILDAEGSAVAVSGGGPANVLLRLYANYVIVDNLEFTGLYWTGIPAYGTSANVVLGAGSPGVGTNIELKNLYIHGWSHNTLASGTSEHPCGVVGDTGVPNNNANTILHSSAIDGADTAKDSCTAIMGSPPYVERNYLAWVSSGLIVNGPVKIDGNSILNVVMTFDNGGDGCGPLGGAHTNGIEINVSNEVTVSNNVIAHLACGTLGIWVAPNQGYTTYIYNNVLYDTDVNNVLDLAAPLINNGCTPNGPTYCLNGGTVIAYNNTIFCGPEANPAAVCAAGIASALAAVTLQNNHWITNATTPNGGMWSTNGVTPTVTTNVLQSKAAAAGEGYTSSQTYPFFQTVGGSTIGAGTNLTGQCSGVLTALCQDSTLGVSYNATTHVVTAPNRTTAQRPAAGAWDVGAYASVVGTRLRLRIRGPA